MSTITETSDANLLLKLWKQNIVDKLTQEAMDAIRPKIVQMAEAAAEELHAEISKYYDIAKDQTVFAFTVKEPK